MFNIIKENFSRAFFALLFSVITIATLSFLSFNTSYGLFLAGSFGATMVLIFGYPESPFAQPKNVFFGHLITSLVAILVIQFLPFDDFIASDFSINNNASSYLSCLHKFQLLLFNTQRHDTP